MITFVDMSFMPYFRFWNYLEIWNFPLPIPGIKLDMSNRLEMLEELRIASLLLVFKALSQLMFANVFSF